ncbi:MAG: hypothetical protein RLZZ15_4342 [Verrucomicrobiota bacterium]|jgi:hypothetical protein
MRAELAEGARAGARNFGGGSRRFRGPQIGIQKNGAEIGAAAGATRGRGGDSWFGIFLPLRSSYLNGPEFLVGKFCWQEDFPRPSRRDSGSFFLAETGGAESARREIFRREREVREGSRHGRSGERLAPPHSAAICGCLNLREFLPWRGAARRVDARGVGGRGASGRAEFRRGSRRFRGPQIGIQKSGARTGAEHGDRGRGGKTRGGTPRPRFSVPRSCCRRRLRRRALCGKKRRCCPSSR